MKKTVYIVCALLAGACGGKKQPELASFAGRSDRMVWDAAQKAVSKKDWVGAREQFRRIVDGFPNSDLGAQARLGLGDTYYREGGTANEILAISEYRQFLTLYPSHPMSDYAQFQVAECFFKQKNGPDRDQTPTQEALAEYEKVTANYPQSKFVDQARSRMTECRHSLARTEHIVGFFYQRTRQSCRSAILRYEHLVTQYPEYKQLDEVLYHLGECLVSMDRKAEAGPYLQRLIESYPQSRFLPEARKLLETVPPPAAPASTQAAPPPPAPPLK